MKKDISVLYAEDNEMMRNTYIKFLRFYFKDVYGAKNGKEALEIYTKQNPKIVILDINMPIIDGLKVAQTIRQRNDNTQIIMLSAYSKKEILLKAIELNLFKYIIKPVNSLEFEKILLEVTAKIEKNQKNIYRINEDFSWDKTNHVLYKNGINVHLTKKEILLCKLICSNPTQTFSNIDILNYVWEDDIYSEYNTNKLRILISKLKSKLGKNLFKSIYNIGYTLNKK